MVNCLFTLVPVSEYGRGCDGFGLGTRMQPPTFPNRLGHWHIYQIGQVMYLNMRLDHPWYPALIRFSTVADLRVSLLEEIRKILTPLPLISWKNLSVWSRAGALPCFIHDSNKVALSFSPLVLFPFHNPNCISDWLIKTVKSRHSLAVVYLIISFD
jgi:hypothetical protein